MSVNIDVAWKSLNKHNEELCGDKVELMKTPDSDIVILADGLGSGVKANILATLTSKILATMLKEGAGIEACVETIARTLPICQVRQLAYATFSILQIFHDGRAYLAEYDNPDCVFIRDRQVVKYPYQTREIEGKRIHEYRFEVMQNDCFVLMSDGVIYAGAGNILNLSGWTWESMAEYTLQCTKKTFSAARLASLLSLACDDLYLQKPGDDTTIVVARAIERKVVNIFTGPPLSREMDDEIMKEFMGMEGKKIVSGGTSSQIASRYLNKKIITDVSEAESGIPPTARIEGLDLVTEGVITLGRVLKLLKQYQSDVIDVQFFNELDLDNGASKIAKLLIEECTHLNLFIGAKLNKANRSAKATFDLSIRKNLGEQMKKVMKNIGKTVTVNYY